MSLEAPWVWLLAVPLLLYAWWLHRRSYAQLVPLARYVSFGLRVSILLLLLAAISRPDYARKTRRPHAVFLLDVSRSVSSENLNAGMDDIERLAREFLERDASARISIIGFGKGARLLVNAQTVRRGWTPELRRQILYAETLPELYARRTRLVSDGQAADSESRKQLDEQIATTEAFRDGVAGDATDIETAMRLALNCGSTQDQRTVYLFTDGHFNRGEWQRACRSLQKASARLVSVRLDKPLPPEVAATDVLLPSAVRVNQGFSAEVQVASTVEVAARLQLFKDGFAFHQQEVRLQTGVNRYTVPDLFFEDKGFHTVEAVITAPQDTRLENNRARTLIVVPGQARILYVDGNESQIPYLKTALELEGMQVDARPANGIPQTLSELLSFDAFILSNVPADRMSLRQMQMIRSYVRDSGGGFIMLGGDESFGLGGYFGTPIEEILPVRMPIQKDLLRPSLAIMLVIDKSGSMEGVKIEIAKRSAIATAEAINPRDQIGVIGFDGESRPILELTSASDRSTVASRIAGLDAGGGTFLYPALVDAQQRLQDSNARKKHVVVLSDGQTQGFGYEELVMGMAADGITLSAVGIGEGADMNLLGNIAKAGGGRSYFTNDLYTVPQIFTREALRAGNQMLVERAFQPIPMENDVSLRGIDTDELPLLTGYVATTPREQADVLLVSDSGDPILARWRCGLGRTAAFTSETKPRWAEDWLNWEDFPKFWSQLLRSITGEELTRQVSVECSHTLSDAGVTLTADVRDAAGDFASDAGLDLSVLNRAGGPAQTVKMERRGPGLFEAVLPQIAYGEDQQFVLNLRGERYEDHVTSYGFVYSFSPEFRTLAAAAEVFDEMQQLGLAEVASVGTTPLHLAEAGGEDAFELWPWLLIAALLLMPVDILVRRLG